MRGINMKRGIFLALIVATILSLCAASPAANLVVNGSFEADNFGCDGGGQCLGLIGNAVTGWYIPNGDGTYPWGLQNANQYGAGPAANGNQWLVLGEVGSRVDYTIQQTMNGLTPGNTYNLSFAIASEQTGTMGSVVEVSFLSGSSTGAQDFTAPIRGITYWNPWGYNSMNFLATSSSVTMQFKDLAAEFPSGLDLGLDNVVVTGSTSVPEPGTFLLLGSSIVGLAGTLRRKLMR